MYSTFYKRRRQHQKPHILTVEQSRELGQLAGNKLVRSIIDNGLIPNNLFRLRKRKLEKILSYLQSHGLVHKKIPLLDNIQTHQLASYLLSIIYPGYSISKAKNQAFTDYRECREKDLGPIPLAYDLVPTTDVYERLDEIFRIDVDWQETTPIQDDAMIGNIDIPISHLKKSIDRVCFSHNMGDAKQDVRYHLCLWNSKHTLIKPICKNLYFNSENTWTMEDRKTIEEGFMHIDVTSRVQTCFDNYKPFAKKKQPFIKIGIELEDNNEQNISHISIIAVAKKSINKLVQQLYLQSSTECISKAIQSGSNPTYTQHKAIHLLKQIQLTEKDKEEKENKKYDDDNDDDDDDDDDEEKETDDNNEDLSLLRNTEAMYIKLLETFRDQSSEDEYDEDEGQEIQQHPFGKPVTLLDPTSHKRIQHPIRSFHCKHRACFDATSFFETNSNKKIWNCPYCLVQIKSTEELQISFPIKVALNQYPNEDRLFVLQDILLSESEILQEASRIMATSLKRTHSTDRLVLCIDDENGRDNIIVIEEREDDDEEETDDDTNNSSSDSSNSDNNEKENHHQHHHHVQKRLRTLTHVM